MHFKGGSSPSVLLSVSQTRQCKHILRGQDRGVSIATVLNDTAALYTVPLLAPDTTPSLLFLHCCLFAVVLEEFSSCKTALIAKHREPWLALFPLQEKSRERERRGPSRLREGERENTYKAGYAGTQI